MQMKKGQGATVIIDGDRLAGTIVQATPTKVKVRRDRAIRLDKNGKGATKQRYTYRPNYSGKVFSFTKKGRGFVSRAADSLIAGVRNEFHFA
jgi:hypothetical protein